MDFSVDRNFCELLGYLSDKNPTRCTATASPMMSPEITAFYGEEPRDRAITIAYRIENAADPDSEQYPTPEKRDQARVGVYFGAGELISHGHGFWQSIGLFAHPNPKEMVRAFVNGLRAKGWTDTEILIFGDSKEGRWLADWINQETTYEEFLDKVQHAATHRPP